MLILVILYKGDGYSHFIHKAKDVGPKKGSVLGITRVGSRHAR